MSVFDIVEDTAKTATAGPIPAVGADFAPGVAEQLASMAATDMPSIPAAAPAYNSEFLAGVKPRQTVLQLEYPLRFEGVEYREIHLRRLTLAEVSSFMERLSAHKAANGTAPAPTIPILTDAAGTSLPDGLMEALDTDDADAIDEAIASFLPRRFRAALDSASSPPTGA